MEVRTIGVSDVTASRVRAEGEVNRDGGSELAECGFCWGTEHNPTMEGLHINANIGVGNFAMYFSGLERGQTYYVRAYAVNEEGVAYGEEVEFVPDDTFTPWSGGSLPGLFSVSKYHQVRFSQGNLQYQASNDMWRFAENQYDYIGDAEEGNVYEGEIKCDNALISPEYYGWIDLFGWGTATNPTLTSTSNSDYATFTDWGINAISNGGNEPNKWRTLTYDEWYYLMYTRVNHDNLQGQAEVNGVHGYIFLPDNWSAPSGLTFQASPNDWTTNQYADSEWLAMEASGALFLPCAGIREGVTINEVGLLACYVSSTPSDKTYVYCVFFREDWAYAPGASKHYVGQSVRLAKEL